MPARRIAVGDEVASKRKVVYADGFEAPRGSLARVERAGPHELTVVWNHDDPTRRRKLLRVHAFVKQPAPTLELDRGDRVESRCRRTYAGTDRSERFYVSPGDTGTVRRTYADLVRVVWDHDRDRVPRIIARGCVSKRP